MTEDDLPDLPPPPPQLLDLLQRLESRLDELDDLREEVRAVRSALQTDTGIGSVTVIRPDFIESTAVVYAATISQGPAIEDPATREWLSALRRRGEQGARLADFLTRAAYVAIKLGEAF